MHRKLSAVVLVSVMALSSIGAAGPVAQQAGNQTAANQPSTNQPSTVSATVTEEVAAEPDEATVHAVVSATGDNASEDLEPTVADLREDWENESWVEAVYTTDHHVTHPGDAADGPGQGAGPPGQSDGDARTVHTALAIELTDVDRIDDVYDTEVENATFEVRNVDLSLSDETEEDLQETAIERAVEDAEFKAVTAAEETGLEPGDVRSVDVIDVSERVHDLEHASEDRSGDEADADALDHHTHKVSVTVKVTYDAQQ